MTAPVRIQLSRRRGFDLQAASRAANGLAAIVVSRPSRWGNPYRVGPSFSAAEAVAAFREAWRQILAARPATAAAELEQLRGKNLACWCKPDEPCHADVLLSLANGGEL